MDGKYKHIEKIDSPELFEEVSAYVRGLMNEATHNGALAEQELKEVYIYEIGRLSLLCADYEANYIAPEILLRKRYIRGKRMATVFMVFVLLLLIAYLVMLILIYKGVIEDDSSSGWGLIPMLILQFISMFIVRRQNVKALKSNNP